MSNIKTLLDLSKKYVDDYLEKFVNQGIENDIETKFIEHINPLSYINPNYQNLNNSQKAIKVDRINERFIQMMHLVQKTSIKSILEKVYTFDNPLIIDVGSKIGERFGLFVAKKNPDSLVYVFNPFDNLPHLFIEQEVFRQILNGNDYYQPTTLLNLDTENLCNSINDFYNNENLNNIRFIQKYFSKKELLKIKEEHPGRKIIIHSHRTPTIPKDITYDLSEMVNEFNVDLIMTPLINSNIDHKNDPLLKKINDSFYGMMSIKKRDTSVRDQLYNIMTLYYALNLAIISNANVYQNYKLDTPYKYPNFIISTINPQ